MVDDCICHKFSGSKHIYLVLYVDASFVLGIQIHRDRSRGILGLSQKSYIEKILKKVWHA